VIPVAFDYVRPSTVEDAIAALNDAGDDGKLLAGGQSLLPVLRLRLAAPTVLIDLNGMPQLRGVREDGDALVIGAMTTHDEVANAALVKQHAPLLAEAAVTVGDRQVRHRGTLGGSLAHADPGADLPAVALALDATYVVAGPNGRRQVSAKDFPVDLFTTALEPNEVLVEVRIPKLSGWGAHYEKFHRTAQAWSMVAVGATVQQSNGTIASARVALANMGPIPVRATALEEALAGCAADAEAITAACAVADQGAAPMDDLTATADYRRHLVRVLAARAVKAAAGV
jgi:aerobic carbon-monoxide dehydrogenase medium subunit